MKGVGAKRGTTTKVFHGLYAGVVVVVVAALYTLFADGGDEWKSNNVAPSRHSPLFDNIAP